MCAATAVVLNFYAPWCPWCQRLEPTWEAVTQEVHKRYPESDGRIRFGKVRPGVRLTKWAVARTAIIGNDARLQSVALQFWRRILGDEQPVMPPAAPVNRLTTAPSMSRVYVVMTLSALANTVN